MYKATKAFVKTESDMLTFKEGDEFNFIEEHDCYWWRVQNSHGETGLVPSSYLKVNMVVKDEVLQSIDRAIDLIHKKAAQSGLPISANERRNLQKLINHRKMVAAGDSMWKSDTKLNNNIPLQPTRRAPNPPSLKKEPSLKNRKAPEPPSQTQSSENPQSKSPCGVDEDKIKSLVNFPVPDSFGADVIETLSYRFGLKPETAQAVAICVCNQIGQAVKPVQPLMLCVEGVLRRSGETVDALNAEVENEDLEKMRRVLDDLTEHKENSQQRGWAIEEDFQTINGLLEKLIEMMASGDKKISLKLLAEDDYRYLHNLVVYYQMETRRKLRTTMLQLFGCTCELKKDMISQLLCSILPTELAHDLMNEKEDIRHLLSTALMMTMLFSTGEAVPYTAYAQLNRDFIKFLLQGIESSFDIDDTEEVPDSFTALLLAFNKHFADPRNSIVMSVLREGEYVRVFSEKIMILLNREEDPAAIFSFCKTFPDSTFKMFTDIFSSRETAQMFFTNDLYVLMDIILRQICNREAGDQVRTEFISLFYSVLQTTDYKEHMYRVDEFRSCFRQILTDEQLGTEADRFIIRDLFSSFKNIFH